MSTHTGGVSRRGFLHTVALGLGAVPLLSACGGDLEPVIPATAFDQLALLDAYFGTDGTGDARAIGDRYNRRFDDEREVEDDLGALLEPVADLTSVDEVVTLLGQTLAGDFDRAEMVSVAGWQLGVTEARLCSLAYWIT